MRIVCWHPTIRIIIVDVRIYVDDHLNQIDFHSIFESMQNCCFHLNIHSVFRISIKINLYSRYWKRYHTLNHVIECIHNHHQDDENWNQS